MNNEETMNKIRSYFSKPIAHTGKRLIDRFLPPDAILFLFEKEKELSIQLAAERTKKDDDYVVIEISSNERWTYIFQLLLDKIAKRYSPGRYCASFKDEDAAILTICTQLTSLRF
ncbi:MAG: hypothetical protein ACK5Z2_00185 [Bacteroidota bacterium]|jgi:hypothetical protein